MLEINNLSKTYVSSKKVKTQALQEISLKLADKGLVFIVGRTGCGKTTFLNILGNLDQPTTGEVLINNQDITKFTRSESDYYRNHLVGFVFQEYNLIEEFSVYENIVLAYKLKNEPEDEEKIDELLKKFDMYHQKHKLCDELSGGQKQRVSIIRSIIKSPKLILADEPTGALDNKTGEDILNILKEISKETLVIVVSHNIEYANRYADRIIEMSDGKIINDTIQTKIESTADNSLEPIKQKSGLGIKSWLKLALINIRHRLKRLMLVLLVLSISFILVGVSSTYLTYDKARLTHQSMVNDGTHQVLVVTPDNANENNSLCDLNENDQIALEGKYNQKFYPLYKLFTSFGIIYDRDTLQTQSFYSPYIAGSMEINEKIADDLGIKLLSGTFPKSDDEVLISDYIFLNFKEFGYSELVNDEYIITPIEKYEDMHNKLLKTPTVKFRIVGVVDTNFNEKRYEKLKNPEISSSKDTGDVNLTFELNCVRRSTITGCIFHNEGFFLRYCEKRKLFDRRRAKSRATIFLPDDRENYILAGYEYGKMSVCNEKVFYKEGYSKQQLDYNEIVINTKKLENYTIDGKSLKEKVEEYVSAYRHDPDFEKSEIYRKYRDQYWDGDITADEFYDLVDWEIENLAYKEYFDEKVFSDLEKVILDVYATNDKHVINRDLTVVGFVNLSPLTETNYHIEYYMSDELFDEFVEADKNYYYRGFFTPIGKNPTFLKKIMNEQNFTAYNQYIQEITRMERQLQQVADVVVMVEIIFIIFSFALFSSYIQFIIKDKKKQIGVLLSLGASKKDILHIFLTESFIIAGFISLIAIIGSMIVTNIINNVFIDIFNVLIKCFSFGALSVLIVISCSLLIAYISTLLPISRLCKKTPIEVMKAARD